MWIDLCAWPFLKWTVPVDRVFWHMLHFILKVSLCQQDLVSIQRSLVSQFATFPVRGGDLYDELLSNFCILSTGKYQTEYNLGYFKELVLIINSSDSGAVVEWLACPNRNPKVVSSNRSLTTHCIVCP